MTDSEQRSAMFDCTRQLERIMIHLERVDDGLCRMQMGHEGRENQLHHLNAALDQLEQLKRTLLRIPCYSQGPES